MSFKMGKKLFEVCQNLEGISVESYFHVYENVDAVSHYRLGKKCYGRIFVYTDIRLQV
jgi:hypothetical protein